LAEYGIIHSARIKERIMRVHAKPINGFIRDNVLIPEVLTAMISLLRTISMRKISMDIRDARGSKRLKYCGSLKEIYTRLSRKLLKDAVKTSMCSMNSIVTNRTRPANSVIRRNFSILDMRYLFSFFKIS
jgi:hypothetical protein